MFRGCDDSCTRRLLLQESGADLMRLCGRLATEKSATSPVSPPRFCSQSIRHSWAALSVHVSGWGGLYNGRPLAQRRVTAGQHVSIELTGGCTWNGREERGFFNRTTNHFCCVVLFYIGLKIARGENKRMLCIGAGGCLLWSFKEKEEEEDRDADPLQLLGENRCFVFHHTNVTKMTEKHQGRDTCCIHQDVEWIAPLYCDDLDRHSAWW